ncbi:MAG: activator of (R)-2-hydroxyglutaryl-CoA dehydratase [Betaproteobacteria bacterium]
MTSDREGEIRRRVAAERARLEAAAGLEPAAPRHFRRPAERPFTRDERDRVTILFGGLTWKHEELLRAIFEAAGYRCDVLPAPDAAACQIGREHGNVGQCNPTYFTVGALIQYLRRLESSGLSRQEICDRFVFFTAGTCGPCRFGMYEAEYRLALQNAGFRGFRVLLFQQDAGVKATTGEPGLKFTVDFGMGALNAFTLGDVLHQVVYCIRPYEKTPGRTDDAMREAVAGLAGVLRNRPSYEILDAAPRWLAPVLPRSGAWHDVPTTLGKIREHLFGRVLFDAMAGAAATLDAVEIDRLRVKPVVKITGEFWAQTTESAGNFRMFEFLEAEGAEVLVDPIGSWVMYLLFQQRLIADMRRGLDLPIEVGGRMLRARLGSELRYWRRRLLFAAGESFWAWQYHRIADALGGRVHRLPDQAELARLAAPFYNPLARGGEGHLEVAKTVYHTVHRHCHMVLSLKPFGCLPSTQSDGAQSAVVSRFKDLIFLPIETAGDGEVHARSRVQMALTDAKARARREFEISLAATGKRLEDVRAYVAGHRELSRALYRVPHYPGVVGGAANFVRHVSDLMDRERHAGRALVGRKPLEQPS